MDVPFESTPVDNIDCPGGGAAVVAVRFPPRAFLTRLVVRQTSGADSGGFTVAVFSRQPAALGQSASAPGVGMISDETWRVTPWWTATAGEVAYITDERGYALGHREDVSGVGFIYVRIQAGGSGPKKFELLAAGVRIGG